MLLCWTVSKYHKLVNLLRIKLHLVLFWELESLGKIMCLRMYCYIAWYKNEIIIGEENGNLGRLGEREIKMFLLQGKRTKEGRQMKS